MSQPGNLVGNSLAGTCLTLPNLGFLGYTFNTLKYPKMGICYFFLCLSLVNHFMLIFIIEDCGDLVLSGVLFQLDISVYWRCLIWLVDLQFSFSVAVVRVVVVAISIVQGVH